MRLGPLLAPFVAHSGGPGAVSWRRAPRGLLPRRSGSPCHGALADVRLTTGQPLGKSSTPVSATDHCSFGTNSVISEPSRAGPAAYRRLLAFHCESAVEDHEDFCFLRKQSPTMSGVGFRASGHEDTLQEVPSGSRSYGDRDRGFLGDRSVGRPFWTMGFEPVLTRWPPLRLAPIVLRARIRLCRLPAASPVHVSTLGGWS
jgi:hypothetical protein